MPTRVAINGLGRIGEMVLRHWLRDARGVEIVAVNDLAPLDQLAYALRYDSVHPAPPRDIASGDLSHVGPAFGQLPMTDDDLVTLRSDDHALLKRLCAGDRSGFFAPIQHSANRTNICGVAPFWLTMAVAEATGGTLIDYEQCPADEDDTSWGSIGGVPYGVA